MPTCNPPQDNNRAYDLTRSHWTTSMNFAQSSYNETLALVDEITAFEVTPIDVNVRFRDNFTNLTPFQKPVVPELQRFEFNISQPPNVQQLDQAEYDPLDIPEAPAPVSIPIPEPPSIRNPRGPGQSPRIVAPTFPDEPDLTLPSVPTLDELDLPDIPSLDIPALIAQFDELRAQRPELPPGWLDDLALDVPGSVASNYNSTKLRSDAAIAENEAYQMAEQKLATMLSGDTGLPVAIEQALFDRAVVREDKSALKREQDVMRAFSSRGYTLPNGVIFGQLQEIYQANQDARQQINRDIYIENARIKVDDIRFAVTQGLVAEQMFRQHFIAMSDQSRLITNLMFEYQANLFNARVSYYQADLAGWQAEAVLFRERIALELSRLEETRLALESSRLKGELNEQQVRIYTEEVRAVLVAADVYRTNVSAVAERLRADEIRINAYLADVQRYTAETQGNESFVRLYAEQVRAMQARADIAEIDVRAYAERVRALAIGNTSLRDNEQFTLQRNQQLIDDFRARLDNWNAQLAAETARIGSLATSYSAESDNYRAVLGAEAARVDADNRSFANEVAEGNARAQLEIEKARLNVEQMLRASQLYVSQLQGATTAMAQLNSSSFSGLSVATGYRHSSSNADNRGCSTSYNYSGTIATPA